MSDRVKRYTALLLSLLMLFSLTACGGGGEQTPVTDDENIQGKSAGREIKSAAAADSVFTLNYSSKNSLNPMTATNTNNQLVCDLVYENMIELDNNYHVTPNVITDWETPDGGVHWVFTVDISRRFHTGEQMTAKDVAYSLTCAMNSERFGRRLNCVIGCSPNDEKTFAVTLSKANLLLPQLMAVPVIKYDSLGEERPMGTGPYTYAKDNKSLVKFSGYKNADLLPLDVIYLKEYNGVDETISAFEDSLIDVVMNDPSAPTNLGYGSSNEIRGINTSNLHYIGFNMEGENMAYEGLRFAMNFAFDRESIVNQFGGFALEAELPVSPASDWYDASYAKQFKYDLKQVQLVLNNMGLKDYDGDGFLEMKAGGTIKEIDVDFILCGASSIKVNVANKFASDMASLGLKVTVRALTWDEYCEALTKGEFDMFYAEVRLTPDFDLTMLTTEGARMNYGGVKDEQLDEIIGRYLASEESARRAACADMCALILNRGYVVPLCFERHQMITHRGVIEGIKPNENNPLYNFANWKISFDNAE